MSLERVYRYYLLKLEGVEEHETCPVGRTEPPRDMPDWFMRHVDTGRVIDRLPHQERAAVEQRWAKAIKLENARRALLVTMMRETAARRAGNHREARHEDWRKQQITIAVGRLERELARYDRAASYRRGINAVLRGIRAQNAPDRPVTSDNPKASEGTRGGAKTREGGT